MPVDLWCPPGVFLTRVHEDIVVLDVEADRYDCLLDAADWIIPGPDGSLRVPDEDLAPLYTGAQVFVYNSIYEGFGLPPLEAMQCGAAVITSSTSSLPEVVRDGGVMVPPNDLDLLAGTMLEVATDTDRRHRLQERALAQARRFTWERSTAATLQAYRTALQA